MLVDTGSAASLISKNVSDRIGVQESQMREFLTPLSAANGTPLKVYGSVELEFYLEEYVFLQRFIVADLLEVNGNLGMDFLENNQVDIQISTQTLNISGNKIRLEKVSSSGCARIKLAKQTVLPPSSELLIEGYIVGGSPGCSEGLVEPAVSLGNKGLMCARTVVDSSKANVCLSVINVSSKPVKLRQNTPLGTLQTFEQIYAVETPKQNTDKQTTATELPEHLKPLVEKASDSLTDEQKQSLTDLLIQYGDIFVGPDGKVGRTDIVKHTIDTGDNHPFKLPMRRQPLAQKPIIENELEKMLEQGVIEPSESPWSSPILLVKKKDGSIRFCIDFRKLNSLTRKDAYPLPRIDECLESLGGSKWFSTLDLASGYWQCEVEESDRPKTAFSTHKGLFQFKVMPFGLSNAPACFERLMELVLRGLLWEKCLCYLDDIIVMGKTFVEALDNLKTVFDRFRNANLKLKPKKCVLFQTEVLFLGHKVTADGITTDPSKVESVKTWPQPTSLSELRSFLGLVGYYRRFIPDFSEIAAPLTRLTQKFSKFVWSPQCTESFEKLKELLVSAPILTFPQGDGVFVLDTDASLEGVGAVLSQIQDGEERVISFASRKLSRTQRNYCTTYRELLAVVMFVKQFHHYLWGRPFVVRTDHSSLLWLKRFKRPEGLLARWLSILDTYDFTIEHRKGSHHSNADTMSRKPYKHCKREDCSQCKTVLPSLVEEVEDGEQCSEQQGSASLTLGTPESHESSDNSLPSHQTRVNTVSPVQMNENDQSESNSNWLTSWTNYDIHNMQENDAELAEILTLRVESDQKPDRSQFSNFLETTKFLLSNWESLTVQNGVLCFQRQSENPALNKVVMVAPSKIRKIIFENLHCKKTAGHLGRDKTIFSVQRRFFWHGMNSDLRRWIHQCDMCCRSKPGPGLGKSPLQQSPVGYPLERIGIDIVGPCPITENGNEFIIVVCDYFTKWVEAYAVPDHTALTVADKLCTEFIARFGTPTQIHSDQGREFESQLFQALCENLEIDKTRTTPYRPNSDGLAERFNKTLQQMLKVFCQYPKK